MELVLKPVEHLVEVGGVVRVVRRFRLLARQCKIVVGWQWDRKRRYSVFRVGKRLAFRR